MNKDDYTMSKLYLDCEWNDFAGQLISLALVSECGKEFYEVINCPNPTEWVVENVIPKLNKSPIPYGEFSEKLHAFLMGFDAIHIVADWPEDIEWFCTVLITGPGKRLDTPPLTMEIIRINTISRNPHNALEDARALKESL